jgi:hypothetical protein
VSRAIRQREYVDAYCAGHSRVTAPYSLDDVRRAVVLLKQRTGRPVAMSEIATRYTEEMAAVGDWIFPDAHLTLQTADDRPPNVDLDRDIDLFFRSTEKVARLAQQTGKPLLFNSVCYPYAGADGASRQSQAAFFRRLLERLEDPQRGLPVKASIVPQTAFDAPWKRKAPFFVWEPFSGLLWAGGRQHRGVLRVPTAELLTPAAEELLRRHPHLKPGGRSDRE